MPTSETQVYLQVSRRVQPKIDNVIVKSFHKEIAFSYGLGLRFELDLFVFRLDGAMKAVNPAFSGKEKYPLIAPDFGRDFTLHFAIGYPF